MNECPFAHSLLTGDYLNTTWRWGPTGRLHMVTWEKAHGYSPWWTGVREGHCQGRCRQVKAALGSAYNPPMVSPQDSRGLLHTPTTSYPELSHQRKEETGWLWGDLRGHLVQPPTKDRGLRDHVALLECSQGQGTYYLWPPVVFDKGLPTSS